MSRTFAIGLPPEQAYVRRVLFAAEIVDAGTLQPVTRGITVKATGLNGKPIVNRGGFYVWLEEGGRLPQLVVVEPGSAPYEPITVAAPVPPARSVRIELAPRYGYPVNAGVTGVRGSMIERRTGPRVPAALAEVWLRWIDDAASGTSWVDAPTRSRTNPQGDFVAILRLAPHQTPRLDASRGLRARLRARHRGTTRTSAEFSLPQGRVADALPPFVWNEFLA